MTAAMAMAKAKAESSVEESDEIDKRGRLGLEW
jgi:hypothetical protein